MYNKRYSKKIYKRCAVMNNIASIAISNTTRKFDKDYHYIIPDKYIGSIVPGMRVIVPFGKSNRLVEGYVLDVLESPEVSFVKGDKQGYR